MMAVALKSIRRNEAGWMPCQSNVPTEVLPFSGF